MYKIAFKSAMRRRLAAASAGQRAVILVAVVRYCAPRAAEEQA